MATTNLIAPQYSFVQMGDAESLAECLAERRNCLPLNQLGNIKFEMFASSLSSPPAVAFPVRTVFAYPVRDDSDCDSHHDIPDLLVQPIIAREYEVLNITGVEAVFMFDVNLIQQFEDCPLTDGIIAVDECFKFKIIEVWTSELDPTTIIETNDLGCTNCFYRIPEFELCWFSTIQYSSNENGYGFLYEHDFENLVLLEFYLRNPQNPSEESSYRKSDGQYIKLSERIEEEYGLQTAYWRHEWHRKMKIALSHDAVNISNFNIGQQAYPLPDTTLLTQFSIDVINKNPYQIAWDEAIDRLYAQASTNVKLSAPVSLYNTNCAS